MIRSDYNDSKRHIHVLSFGAGTQSSAMLIKALRGEFDGVIPDYIIFADTGWEPKHVHDWLEKMQGVAKQYGKEIVIARNGNIRDDILRSFETGERAASLPLYTKDDDDEGIIRRQCTMEYKITPIEKTVRQLLGYQKGERVKEIVHMWKGISTDEVQRVKPSQKGWIVNEHPFIFDQPRNRSECIAFVEREGLGTPPKSSCIGCPYHNDLAWKEIKDNQPDEWADAVAFDKAIRKHPRFKSDTFLHKSRVPLDEVDFNEDQMSIFNVDDFDNECAGMCGI